MNSTELFVWFLRRSSEYLNQAAAFNGLQDRVYLHFYLALAFSPGRQISPWIWVCRPALHKRRNVLRRCRPGSTWGGSLVPRGHSSRQGDLSGTGPPRKFPGRRNYFETCNCFRCRVY